MFKWQRDHLDEEDKIIDMKLSSEDPVQQVISEVAKTGSEDGYIPAMHSVVSLVDNEDRQYDNKTMALYSIANNYKITIKIDQSSDDAEKILKLKLIFQIWLS